MYRVLDDVLRVFLYRVSNYGWYVGIYVMSISVSCVRIIVVGWNMGCEHVGIVC